jgi:hypothetical protein
MPRRGVIYAVGPSPKDVNVVWAGTDDGLVHVTRDGGKSWQNVTPKALRAWDKVSQIDAGHADARTAYVAVNAIRRDDMRPHIYRTHDGGTTWTEVVTGLPATGPVNVVREDPRQPNLLYAGTERQVFFSIDDGDHWQSLRQNMPASSVRDLVIHDDDLVVGTHGRSIWILDGITTLRELAAAARSTGAFLFTPPQATRVRWNMFSDTPLPPEEPTGQNPPEGAVLDYYLPASAGDVTLEIRDRQGSVVRRYSSSDEPERIDPSTLPYPTYWMRPPQALSKERGHHRFVWDLRYAPPKGARRELSIAAIYHNTGSSPVGPLVHPGRYTVRLSAGGASVERSIDVRMDPRVTIADTDLRQQTDLSLACYRGYGRLQDIREVIDSSAAQQSARREQQLALRGAGTPENPDILYDSITAVDASQETVVGLQQKLLFMMSLLQAADARPTSQAAAAVKQLTEMVPALERRWESVRP